MAYIKPRNQEQIALDTGLSPSQVAAWVTDSEPFADGSGYTVFFKISTPLDVQALVPGLDKSFRLVVANEDMAVRQRRQG